MATCYMYILKCIDNKFYVGSTRNLLKRIELHQKGHASSYTSRRLPVELIYYEEFSRIDEAFEREHQVKKWGRDKKEALIEGRHSELPLLAKCQNKSHFENREYCNK
ncbi:GIY-YIG nuclease family protein [Halocola ammonii]